jgi:hypothetical protein
MYSWPTKDIEPGMSPGEQHVDEILSDFTFAEEHFEELMLEDHSAGAGWNCVFARKPV